MKSLFSAFVLLITAHLSFGQNPLFYSQNEFEITFQNEEIVDPQLIQQVKDGMEMAESFFELPFNTKIEIHVFADRSSLDKQWQQAWGVPDFQSECWMVASGAAGRFDILSPKTWSASACEHDATDLPAVQKLITHELVHILHGAYNPHPGFEAAQGIDWFIEGLATYASGQLDKDRISRLKKSLFNGEIPDTLSLFWTGPNKYGLSGSLVAYIDKKYGREQLIELLPLNTLDEVLKALNTTENELIQNWKQSLGG